MAFARVYYSTSGSPTQVRAGDLHYQEGKPLLVLKWRREAGRRVPAESIELDPARLRPSSSNGTIYRYEGDIGPAG
jgi:hypothetical protein